MSKPEMDLDDRLMKAYFKYAKKEGKKGLNPVHVGATLGAFIHFVMETIPEEARPAVRAGFRSQQELLVHLEKGGELS